MLHLYRRLLRLRRASPALTSGSWSRCVAPSSVLAFERVHGDDRRVVATNFADAGVDGVLLDDGLGRGLSVQLSSLDGPGRRREGRPWDGRLRSNEAVVLRARGGSRQPA
jgi:alpha-glucosidase